MNAAQVTLERQARGAGFISHPAVIDNCMQMGPGIGVLAAKREEPPLTRVVAGLAGFQSQRFPQRGAAFAVAEMLPLLPGGDIYTGHWMLGASGGRSLAIRDLKVALSPISHSQRARAVEQGRSMMACNRHLGCLQACRIFKVA